MQVTQFISYPKSSIHNLDDRKQVLEELGGAFEFHIPTESLLAFKADLNIPWNKLRTIKRYM